MVKLFVNGKMVDLTLNHIKDELKNLNQDAPLIGEELLNRIEKSGLFFISLSHLREIIKKEVEYNMIDIKIIECDLRDSCEKYNPDFCFNEYVDVCGTHFAITVSRMLLKNKEREQKKE